MNPEFKENWIQALESGKYIQGQLALKGMDIDSKDYCYCAMGVLIEEAGFSSELDFTYKSGYKEFRFLDQNGIPATVTPTAAMMEMFGLKDEQVYHITKLNDLDEHTFADIANWIKENL